MVRRPSDVERERRGEGRALRWSGDGWSVRRADGGDLVGLRPLSGEDAFGRVVSVDGAACACAVFDDACRGVAVEDLRGFAGVAAGGEVLPVASGEPSLDVEAVGVAAGQVDEDLGGLGSGFDGFDFGWCAWRGVDDRRVDVCGVAGLVAGVDSELVAAVRSQVGRVEVGFVPVEDSGAGSALLVAPCVPVAAVEGDALGDEDLFPWFERVVVPVALPGDGRLVVAHTFERHVFRRVRSVVVDAAGVYAAAGVAGAGVGAVPVDASAAGDVARRFRFGDRQVCGEDAHLAVDAEVFVAGVRGVRDLLSVDPRRGRDPAVVVPSVERLPPYLDVDGVGGVGEAGDPRLDVCAPVSADVAVSVGHCSSAPCGDGRAAGGDEFGEEPLESFVAFDGAVVECDVEENEHPCGDDNRR